MIPGLFSLSPPFHNIRAFVGALVVDLTTVWVLMYTYQ